MEISEVIRLLHKRTRAHTGALTKEQIDRLVAVEAQEKSFRQAVEAGGPLPFNPNSREWEEELGRYT